MRCSPPPLIPSQLPWFPAHPYAIPSLPLPFPARPADYWTKVALPPEVIEAQLASLAATTAAHLEQYHATVAAAQVG